MFLSRVRQFSDAEVENKAKLLGIVSDWFRIEKDRYSIRAFVVVLLIYAFFDCGVLRDDNPKVRGISLTCS